MAPPDGHDGLWIDAGKGEDARALALLASQAFTKPWREADFAQALSDERVKVLVLRRAGSEPGTAVVAYVVLRIVVDEMEVLDLAVAPALQGLGHGRRLVREALVLAEARCVRMVFLEVREGNRTARHLYEGAGFRLRSRRNAYYSEPREDALVMSLALSGC